MYQDRVLSHRGEVQKGRDMSGGRVEEGAGKREEEGEKMGEEGEEML